MPRSIAIVALACLTLTGRNLPAQNPLPINPLNQNAALSYWQAFALLPQIDDEMSKRLSSAACSKSAVDDDLHELIDSSENALQYLHRGARTQACGWGIANENGPYAYLPHLSKARQLALVALLRARIRFDAGQADEGIDDTIAAIQLGRHAGQEGVVVLINILVGFAIETQAIETIAAALHTLSRAQRETFQQRLSQIRPALDMKAALQGEKDVFLGWLIREIESGRSGEAIPALVSGDTDQRITSRVKNASQEQLLVWAKALGGVYDTGCGFMSLSPQDAMTKEKELVAQLGDTTTGNPLGELFLPSFGSARRAEASFLTSKKLLEAAFAVFDGDQAALNRPACLDPFGDGPFELKRVEGGAELVSDLRRGDDPIKLHIPGLAP